MPSANLSMSSSDASPLLFTNTFREGPARLGESREEFRSGGSARGDGYQGGVLRGVQGRASHLRGSQHNVRFEEGGDGEVIDGAANRNGNGDSTMTESSNSLDMDGGECVVDVDVDREGFVNEDAHIARIYEQFVNE